MLELNCDSQKIKNFELTPEGYLKFWLAGGVPNQDLVYDTNRIEYITEEILFNEDSISTLIGKPITLSHPPRPIRADNFRELAVGTTLQQYTKDNDTNALMMSGMIFDPDVIKKIISGEYQFTSAGYTAPKEKQQDGRILQLSRNYDHVAILPPEYAPRAGKNSKILVIQEDCDIDETKEKNDNTVTEPQTTITNEDMGERVELWTQYRSLIETNNKTLDYNLDSRGIKRLVLSCFYPDNIIQQANTDGLLDGMWLVFSANNYDVEKTRNEDSRQATNNNHRQNYIQIVTGKK